ncbi:gamma-glutamyl-gamma-aminobutyrate hydrolase family protein [Methylomarinum sp. Ch1-1]|uniref:Gamma-glutamyl-gamma-aminobutyrate hydrolase family protein n=1 Tax=Methylomarinum roseum TaxID=3067653 RepID=A0AAU7NSH9_9GAMM|nr:gamma-glutamyl-gamma-aminobutyrate hydrolase family protein [Methylomarinum sp. Ch1-1]MDP4520071.1 gamma-glutamyl-gamma-aminobutyrate hydrolase family protein [Methylomarinum sp. Ch1-1]
MAKRPRVGVTGNDRRWAPSWWCIALALRLAGAVPERISVKHQPSGKPLHALIIGGGNDISPEHYNHDIEAKVKLDPKRDRLEIEWIHKALDNKIPLLGICRGAQLINVVLGGTLYQDIRPLRKRTYNRPGLLPTKQVHIDGGSKLAQICGKTHIRVNSLHHQAINKLGVGLNTVGRDLDLITQAVEGFSDNRIIGVQWHPEYLIYMPSQFSIFQSLLKNYR